MSELITKLSDNEVFIFGSNSTGHSCSGSAGWAIRGDKAGQPWRTDPWVQQAMRAPVGSPDRVGNWGVYGVARGWSKGHNGMSYAIETILEPGLKRSTPLWEIEYQIEVLIGFVRKNPQWRFLMTAVGSNLAGYTEEEMASTFDEALAKAGCWDEDRYVGPSNFWFPVDLYGCNWTVPWGKNEKAAQGNP